MAPGGEMRVQAVRRALRGALAVVFLMCMAGPTMPYPGWARGWQPLPVSEQECINRVNRAFNDEGFSGLSAGAHHVAAVKGSFVFMIACVDIGGGRSEALVFAATDQNSNAVPLGEQRDRLLARLVGMIQPGASNPSG